MFERRNIKRIYLNITGKTKDFLLSDKSREFLIFLFFFFKRNYLKKQKKNRAFVQKYRCFLI